MDFRIPTTKKEAQDKENPAVHSCQETKKTESFDVWAAASPDHSAATSRPHGPSFQRLWTGKTGGLVAKRSGKWGHGLKSQRRLKISDYALVL